MEGRERRYQDGITRIASRGVIEIETDPVEPVTGLEMAASLSSCGWMP